MEKDEGAEGRGKGGRGGQGGKVAKENGADNTANAIADPHIHQVQPDQV